MKKSGSKTFRISPLSHKTKQPILGQRASIRKQSNTIVGENVVNQAASSKHIQKIQFILVMVLVISETKINK